MFSLKAQLTHFVSSIEPDNTALIRMLKYRSAMIWRAASAVKRKLSGANFKNEDEVLNLEDLQSISEFKTKVSSKPKILLLGPYHYKQPMWSVRAKAALPDLIAPLSHMAEVHWVTPIPNNEVLSTIIEISEKNKFHHHLLPPSYNLKSLLEQRKILDELIGRVNPKIVMNAFGVIASGFDAVSSAKRHNILSVLRVPGDELNAQKKMKKQASQSNVGLNIKKASFAITNADYVMVMSDSEKTRISSKHQRKKNVFVQIRGVDTAIFKPEENKNFQNEIINVGFAGRLTSEKGTDILLETVEKLSKNSNIKFHIASPEKGTSDLLQKYNNLKWHGYISHENIPAFMQEMDALILPSHMEGRSQTMMEAMSCSLPVLMQKHIHPQKLPGMVHCNEEAQTFINEIIMLESDRKYLMKLSHEARQSAIKYFDKNTWSKSMASKFQSLLESA